MTAHAPPARRRPASVVLAVVLALVASLLTGSLATSQAAASTTSHTLQVSAAADRSSPGPLEGASLAGDVFVFVEPGTGLKRVEFFLDDPGATGTPVKVEGKAPWDLGGTARDGSALPYDTTGLSEGSHLLTARLTATDNSTSLVSASFTVANDAPAVTATPGAVALSGEPGGAPVAATVTLAASDGSALDAAATTDQPWLDAAVDGSTLTVTADPAALAEGSHSGAVTVTSPGLREAVVPVELTLGAPATTDETLRYSTSADRAGAVDLEGATVNGDVHVFATADGPTPTSVEFAVDGQPERTENNAPYDLAGGSASAANPFDTTTLADGQHTVTATYTYPSGPAVTVSATFAVDNSAGSLSLDPTSVALDTEAGGAVASSTATVSSSDGSAFAPSVSSSEPWLTASVTGTGAGTADIGLSADPAGLAEGTHTATVTVSADGFAPVSGAVTFTVFPVGGPAFTLLYSLDNERGSPASLAGATVSGVVYPFLDPASGADNVVFWLDDPAMTSEPFNTDTKAPFDFASTTPGGRANPWDSATVRDGTHTITALVTTGGGDIAVTREFTTDNGTNAFSFDTASLAVSAPQGGEAQSFPVLLTSTAPATATLSSDANWVGFGAVDTVDTPANLTVVVDPSQLTPGTYRASVTASAPGVFEGVLPIEVTVGDPSDCSPVACELIKVGTPYALNWLYDSGRLLDADGTGTGLTTYLPHSGGAGYDRSLVDVDTSTGLLTMTTTSGGFSNGTQDNAIGVGFDGTALATTISATLVGVPDTATGRYEQAGIWFGYDQDHLSRFSVQSISGGRWRVEHAVEIAGEQTHKKTRIIEPTDGPVTLNFVTDPENRTVTSVYSLGTGGTSTLSTAQLTGEFFSFDAAGIDPLIGTRSFAGIYASDRSGPTNQFTFSDFELSAQPPGGGVADFQFDRASFDQDFPTAMEFGPDGKLYTADVLGTVRRYGVATGPDVADYGLTEEVATVPDGNSMTLGLAIGPESTPSDVVVYVAKSSSVFGPGVVDSGKILRLSGPGLETVEEVITGLPRSYANHGPNDIDFGPDGRLYINLGGNTGAGSGNTAGTEFDERHEQPLAAAVLVADLDAPGFDGSCQNVADMYGPNPCDVEVYASGLRNSYDQVWHSNGRLYATNNGLGVVGSYPPSPTAPCFGFGDTRSWQVGGNNPGAQQDSIYDVVEGGYYGHPNPTIDKCVFGDGSYQGVAPDPDYVPPMYQVGLNTSTNGIIEYTGGAFCGLLDGDLLVLNYSLGDNIVRLELSEDGSSVVGSTSIGEGFAGPLPIAQGPDGSIWIGEFDGDRITVLVPRETGCWDAAAAPPDELLDTGGAAVGDELVVVGGKNDQGHRNDTLVYDAATDTWRRGADLPGSAVENPAVVEAGGLVYAFGGSTAAFSGAVSDAAVYDPAADSWTVLPDLPTARGGAAAAVAGGRIYVVGGMDGTGASVDTVEVFDIATGTWSAGPSLPAPRDNPSAAVVGDTVHVFGGRVRLASGQTQAEKSDTTWLLAPGATAWADGTPMPTARRTTQAAVVGGLVYVVGGEGREDGIAYDTVEVYDPATGEWTNGRRMPTGRHGVAVGVVDGRLHVVGGAATSGYGVSTDHQVFTP